MSDLPGFDPFPDVGEVLTSQIMATPAVTTPPTADEPSVAATSAAAASSAAVVTPSPAAAEPSVAPSSAAAVSSAAAATSAAEVSTAPSSAAAPVATSTTTSVTPASSAAPVAASSAAASSAASVAESSAAAASSSTTSTVQTTRVVTVTNSAVSAPGLVTNISGANRSTSSAKLGEATSGASKGGIGGSGLPVGGLVGIIVGAVAVLAIIGFFITRSMRKRARAKRTANRSSLFEPWPAPVAMEDEPYEKPAFNHPAQSYPMQHASSDAYADGNYPAYDNSAYPDYNEYPPQSQYGQYDAQPYSDMGPEHMGAGAAGAGLAGAGAAAVAGGAAAAAASGIHDNMMVRVKVAFVRSLEDELAITPGQQLYLHTAYDDGWTLCEDQAQNRGVVPLSCLEPWDEPTNASQNDEALAPDATARRRSSLYTPQ